MDLGEIKAIAQAGMSLQRLKVEMAGVNIANANSIMGHESGSLKVYNVNTRYTSSANFQSLLNGSALDKLPEVSVNSTNAPVNSFYEPDSPFADSMGMVQKPAIDTVQEMLKVIAATRAYEANIRIYNSASAMGQKALEIGAKR